MLKKRLLNAMIEDCKYNIEYCEKRLQEINSEIVKLLDEKNEVLELLELSMKNLKDFEVML